MKTRLRGIPARYRAWKHRNAPYSCETCFDLTTRSSYCECKAYKHLYGYRSGRVDRYQMEKRQPQGWVQYEAKRPLKLVK